MEQTFVMIKPTALQRNLVGEIVKRIEQKGLMINALKMIKVTHEQAQQHYDIHQNKPFYEQLISSITQGPVVVMVIAGIQAVEIVRLLSGATSPIQALPGTIRGDFSADMTCNLIHSADSVERAQYEIKIYFQPNEILEYDKKINSQVYWIK